MSALYRDRLDYGLSARSVQFLHMILHRAFKQAVMWGLMLRNPVDLVQAPRPVRHEFRALTADESRQLLDAVQDEPLEAFYVLALTTGMRLGELLGLRWGDINLDGSRLQVKRTLQRINHEVVLSQPKSERSRRSISMSALAVAALRRHRARQLETKLAAGVKWDEDYVFSDSLGEPLVDHFSRRGFRRMLKKAELPIVRFHDLRHSAATILLSGGIHPKIVQDLPGHSTVSLTLDVYSHRLPNLPKEAADQMDSVLGRPTT